MHVIVEDFPVPECRVLNHLLGIHHLLSYHQDHHQLQQLYQQWAVVRVVEWCLRAHLNVNHLISRCLEAWLQAPLANRGQLPRYVVIM